MVFILTSRPRLGWLSPTLPAITFCRIKTYSLAF